MQAIVPYTYFEANPSDSSIACKIQRNQDILLGSVKRELFTQQLTPYWSKRDTSISTSFRYSRKQAYEFFKLGVKNNPDFITASTFGQLFQVCSLRDADFAMMQNENNSFDTSFVDSYCDGDIREENE